MSDYVTKAVELVKLREYAAKAHHTIIDLETDLYQLRERCGELSRYVAEPEAWVKRVRAELADMAGHADSAEGRA